MNKKLNQQKRYCNSKNNCHIFLPSKRHSGIIPRLKTITSYFTLAQSLFFMNVVFAQEEVVEVLDYVPVFRAGHNVSLLMSGEYTTWEFQQSSAATNQDKISPFNNSGANAAFYVRYAYHINIISFFGFFIGTTAGAMLEVEPFGSLKQSYGFLLPTLLGGLVANIGHNTRILAGIEYGATWYPEMKLITDTDQSKTIAPVPDMYTVFGGLDYFVTWNKAVTFQAGWRKQMLGTLNNNSSNTYLNTISLKNESYFIALGFTVQIGDFNQAFNSVLPKGY